MDTRIDPVAEHVYRISTFSPDGPPGGITFNQFLVIDEEPLLVHTGMRAQFPSVRDAVATVIDPTSIAWITSTHASRPDEYGALDEWLAEAPGAQVAHGHVGCFVCLFDVAARPPRPLGDGETFSLGRAEVQWFDTPHVPGPWEAGVLFEPSTRTLFCGDLFARGGRSAVTTSDDVVGPAITHDQAMHGTAYTPDTGPTLRRLAALAPERLALMHGPMYVGDGAAALERLADYYDAALAASLDVASAPR
jgi:flavorubredoxin